ncbi:MAG: DUF1553 domain-containing protein [Planctomycetaceae bacterium]
MKPTRWHSACYNNVFALAGVLLTAIGLPAFIPRPFDANAAGEAAKPASQRIQFNRDVRPILSDTCFQCHGPDEKQRQAGLRLDQQESAFAEHDGQRPLVAGSIDQSDLYARITSTDPDVRMPPPDSGKELTPRQIEIIKQWIEQGAEWQEHWSLLTPVRPDLPDVDHIGWADTPIDRFILARLEREGLAPSAPANRESLIRRVTLDLTGLPPTPAEIDDFLADESLDAYERVVDRLLASPRYGERLATRWLDGARYADTNGYQTDGEREMWRWRDWVINAYNANMPFDQFTREQLAGDLLPDPTLDQLIATGFNRNHRGNAEGGIVPEEYAVEYVVDRIETTSTVWMGLTMGCCRCHDHKFDPISQRDFYRMYAFFNNLPEKGRALKYGNSPPYISAPTPIQQQKLAQLDRTIRDAAEHWDSQQDTRELALKEWEQQLLASAGGAAKDWTPTEHLHGYFPLDTSLNNLGDPTSMPETHYTGIATNRSGDETKGDLSVATLKLDSDDANAETKVAATGPANAPTPETPRAATFAPGKLGDAIQFTGGEYLDAGNTSDFGFFDRFTIAAWIYPEKTDAGTIVSRMNDEYQGSGYGLNLRDGKLLFHFTQRWSDDAMRVETEQTLEPGRWHHLCATYDGLRSVRGVAIYINGEKAPLKILFDDLNQSFAIKAPLRIGAGGGPESRFNGLIDDVRIYSKLLSPEEALILATPETVAEIVAIPAEERTAGQTAKLMRSWIESDAPAEVRDQLHRRLALDEDRRLMVEAFPTVMVMQELPERRPAYILNRGEYDKRGEQVEPGIPAALPAFSEAQATNRLDLANWLLDPRHPLTSRVAVNRMWQMYFGTGLAKTTDDFGSQGEWPIHPELLDWLATEFISSGWDMKHIQRLIVTSAVYRQSSKASPELVQRDPDNRLLARGPRIRFSAQMIRDGSLAISGLLVDRVGGPSVKPYQPDGIWKDLAGLDYDQGSGADLYRRSMYTFWKRTIAPPSMLTFDAAGRETCIVRETRTNTPLQALTLMNEITYVEASRVLAERIMQEGGATPAERLTYAFRLATSRRPTERELSVLVKGFERHQQRYQQEPAAAEELLKIGESPVPTDVDHADLAAYAAVGNVILNLDEVITKE